MKPTILIFPIVTMLAAPTFGQQDEDSQDWARRPQEIAFQNDSQWIDNRWQHTDIGPFLTATIDTPVGRTLKGLAIRVGDDQQATVCFDTARLRISTVWKGGFLQFGDRRFGLIQNPRAVGESIYSSPRAAGWAKGERFQPRPDEITLPLVEAGYTAAGESVTRLPRDWASYHGLYLCDGRVVLSYNVGETRVLDSPWYVATEEADAITRSIQIAPADNTMRMWVCGADHRAALVGDSNGELIVETDGTTVLVLPPHAESTRFQVVITSADRSDEIVETLKQLAGDPPSLSQWLDRPSELWPADLVTVGTTTDGPGAYVIDTLTVPFDNPYNALMFTSGHDFFADGKAAVCTVHGDVWTVEGIDRELGELRWRRFATGLFQPLGLKIVDDKVYVIGRDQITRLHDRDDNGEADFYECFNNDLFVTPRNHDYVTCLDTDPHGNFYFIHAKTGVMRVAADGSSIEQVADGFRNPNGMAVGPDGTITAAPQQGGWTPESCIIRVEEGGYYGFGGPRITEQRPTGWDLPLCFIPRAMDNSGGAQVWVEGDRWGPLSGQMLHLSFGRCQILLTLMEQTENGFQGGTIQLPTSPGDFESGIMRGRFNPTDGQLYVSGLRGWQTRAVRDGCFQRLRYTGQPIHLPTSVKTYSNGIELQFSEPLDRSLAQDPDNYFVEQWNYKWSQEYGSPDYSVSSPDVVGRDEVIVRSATLSADGTKVFLEMPERVPVNQLSITWLIGSPNGRPIRGTYAHTINEQPSQAFPDSAIVRIEKLRRISEEMESRLEPGLMVRFLPGPNFDSDTRVSRLAALFHSASDHPTPFLRYDPITTEYRGTLRVPLRGLYDFKFEGNGEEFELRINGQVILSNDGSWETAQPVLLDKGHNLVEIDYSGPVARDANMRLMWKGVDFVWEPIPPDALFHDPQVDELKTANLRRAGRQLFADHQCNRCHQTDIGESAMFELSLGAPDLADTGDRLNEEWLRRWLEDPHALRRHTPMPAILGEGESATEAAADIAAFLSTLNEGEQEGDSLGDSNQQQVTAGEGLYEQLSCIACHHFERPNHADEYDRISLHYADAKYRHGAMAEFLMAPHQFDHATEMPDFGLTSEEAAALAAYVRSRSAGAFETNEDSSSLANADRGRELLETANCRQCHAIGESQPTTPPKLAWDDTISVSGCLSAETEPALGTPNYAINAEQQQALLNFVQNERNSLSRPNPVETAERIYQRLRCANCHDRDGIASHRMQAIIDEGSGRLPETLPQLTWAGEKIHSDWTGRLIDGSLDYKPRPWLSSRMPTYPAYAAVLAQGMAHQHAVDPAEPQERSFDEALAAIGDQLTQQTTLDCRQCHGVGESMPRGDENTEINRGINFAYIRDRMRRDSYHRFMMDPPRYDINSRMVKLSEDGLTTQVRQPLDNNAQLQFEAIWHFIQSLPEDE